MSHWLDLAALLRMEHVIGTLGTVRERRGEEGEERLKRGACWQGLWCHCTARRKLGGGRGVVYTLKLTRRSSPVRHWRNGGRKAPSWTYVNAPASVFVETINSRNTHMFAPRVSKMCFLIKMQASTNTHAAHFDQMWGVTAWAASHLSSSISHPSSFISVSCLHFFPPPPLEDNFVPNPGTRTCASAAFLGRKKKTKKNRLLSFIPAIRRSWGKDQKMLM